ncbi:MAG: flagellar biosynthetic protein FliQ [Oligoflexia bacterium]|nr:flagellar biosynthetic protein FliQ [Oligoflexia bacterium]
MMYGVEVDFLYEALRAFFVLAFPVLAIVSLAGLLIGAFQGATSIKDGASAYAVRLLALIGALYALLPLYSRTLMDLVQAAFN